MIEISNFISKKVDMWNVMTNFIYEFFMQFRV